MPKVKWRGFHIRKHSSYNKWTDVSATDVFPLFLGGRSTRNSVTLTTRNNSVPTLKEWSWNIHTDFSSSDDLWIDGKVYIATPHYHKSCLSWHRVNEIFDTYFFVIEFKKNPTKQQTHPDSANLFISITQGVKINVLNKESSVIRCTI